MGMFDTFHLQHQGRHLAVQSKQFAQGLDDYHLGDFVAFEHASSAGVTAWIEDHKQDWQDPVCPLEWIALLLVDGCFLDAYVTDTEADARQAAEVMIKLWQSPERQVEALKHHAQAHYEARTRYRAALGQISSLLRDYAQWEQEKSQGNSGKRGFAFLRCDFEKASWDWHLARLLLGLEELREFVPVKYAVAETLENPKGRE